MAYPHMQQEILMTTASGASATIAGDIAEWGPLYKPHIVRAVMITPTVSGTDLTGVVINFNHLKPVSSGFSSSSIDVINGTATVTPGVVMYADGLNVEISPGDRVVCNVGTAASGINVMASIFVEPRHEEPTNDTGMVVTT